jgi:1,2-diacylglycerol 3-alpha-glucosyltransferase
MKIALLCSGLGRVHRGHEVFARDLYTLLGDAIDMTLFKGGGEPGPREQVIESIARDDACLDGIHVAATSKWTEAIKQSERIRIEGETFAYAALQPLLRGGFDVIHCLEREVCDVLFSQRHLFKRVPQILFSNGGAIPARNLPRCDFVQEHTARNLSYSARGKSFLIPHGVDLSRFNLNVSSEFRQQHGIPQSAFLVISVGAISHVHKRMDYVIEEVARVKDAHLLIVGQESRDTPEIKLLGKRLMGHRITFETLAHAELPSAYAAADVFTLGSVFETFGIVYIEAMAMGLPVICSHSANQREIVKEGIFINMKESGELTRALQETKQSVFDELAQKGRQVVHTYYDLSVLKKQYLERYESISMNHVSLPRYTWLDRLGSNARNAVQQFDRMVHGNVE